MEEYMSISIQESLSDKIFESEIIKTQFDELFKRNDDEITKKYQYYLIGLKLDIIESTSDFSKENILLKVKEVTQNYIITEVLKIVFEYGGHSVIFDKVCTMLLVDEEKILSYILQEAIYIAFNNSLGQLHKNLMTDLEISYYCDKKNNQ